MAEGKKVAATKIAAMRERVIRQCNSMGIDIERIPHDDAAVRVATKALKRMADRMKAREDRSTTAPTPERVRHAAGGVVEIDNGPSLPKAHKIRRPIDEPHLLSLEEHTAADRLQQADEMLHGATMIGGYDGTSGGGGYRPGKLELTERQQVAGAFRAAMMQGWTPPLMAAIDNFILERPPQMANRCLTWEEFGYEYCHTNNRQVASRSAKLTLKITCGLLAMRARAWDRGSVEASRQRRGAA